MRGRIALEAGAIGVVATGLLPLGHGVPRASATNTGPRLPLRAAALSGSGLVALAVAERVPVLASRVIARMIIAHVEPALGIGAARASQEPLIVAACPIGRLVAGVPALDVSRDAGGGRALIAGADEIAGAVGVRAAGRAQDPLVVAAGSQAVLIA